MPFRHQKTVEVAVSAFSPFPLVSKKMLQGRRYTTGENLRLVLLHGFLEVSVFRWDWKEE